MQKLPPRSLSSALMTWLDGEPSPDTPSMHSRRGDAHRSRRPRKEGRRRMMFSAIPVDSHARTVLGPASLGSDSTATSVPMADGSAIINFNGLLPFLHAHILSSISYCSRLFDSASENATKPLVRITKRAFKAALLESSSLWLWRSEYTSSKINICKKWSYFI